MQAYDDVGMDAAQPDSLDAFCASRAAFDALVATLGSAQAGGWTHDQLEDYLETDGRELLRRLLQDHLDLRALREQHAVAQGRIGPVTDAGGIGHRKVEPGHVRYPTTSAATCTGSPMAMPAGRNRWRTRRWRRRSWGSSC